MIPVAHAMAHAKIPAVMDAHVDENRHHEHGSDAHDYGVHQSNDDEHHHSKGHPGDHGAELHITALSVSPIMVNLPMPERELRAFYADLQPPPPLLPPDPDPDRA